MVQMSSSRVCELAWGRQDPDIIRHETMTHQVHNSTMTRVKWQHAAARIAPSIHNDADVLPAQRASYVSGAVRTEQE